MFTWTLEPVPSHERSYLPAGSVLPLTLTSSYTLTVAFSPANAAEARRSEAPRRRPLVMFFVFIKSPLVFHLARRAGGAASAQGAENRLLRWTSVSRRSCADSQEFKAPLK